MPSSSSWLCRNPWPEPDRQSASAHDGSDERQDAMTNPDVSASSARTMWRKAELTRPGGGRLGRRSLARSEAWFATFLVTPALLVIAVVVFLPLVYSVWLSFAEVDLLKRTGPALEFFGMRL